MSFLLRTGGIAGAVIPARQHIFKKNTPNLSTKYPSHDIIPLNFHGRGIFMPEQHKKTSCSIGLLAHV